MRSCRLCGKPLSANEISCKNCGYYNPFMQENNPNSHSGYGQPSSNTIRSGAVPRPSSAQAQFGISQRGLPLQSAPPAGSVPQMPFPSSGSVSQMPFPSQQSSAASPGWPNQTARNGNLYAVTGPTSPSSSMLVPQQPFSSPSFLPVTADGHQPGIITGLRTRNVDMSPPVRLRPRIGPIIGAIVLLVILVGGGVLASAQFFGAQNAPKKSPPAATFPIPKGPPAFADSFRDNGKGWDLQGDTNKPGKFSVAIGHNALTLEDDNNKLLWEMVPGGRTFSDFKLFVDATLMKGEQNNGYGIYIRGASNATADLVTYYRFELYGDGTYAIFKGTVNSKNTSNSIKLVDYTMSPVIQKQGNINHILIVAHGPSLTLMVNGQKLKTISDPDYTSGSIALFVSNLQSARPGAQAKFSNFAIYPL